MSGYSESYTIFQNKNIEAIINTYEIEYLYNMFRSAVAVFF